MLLDRANLKNALLQRCSHLLMHCRRIVAFHKIRLVAVSDQQRFQFFVRDAREYCGICDLVTVEVQHRQNGAIANRIQEFVRMPGSCQRTSLGLTIAYRDGDDEIGIVERRAISVREE